MSIEQVPHKNESQDESIENIPTPSNNDDIRQFTKDFSPFAREELANKIRTARLRRELGIIQEEEERETINKLQTEFKNRFTKQKQDFDIESLKERSVEEISKNQKLIFVHTVPLDDFDQQANTQMNNGAITTGGMTTLERIGTVMREHPTISCSTIKIDAPKAYGADKQSMYPFGVVVGSGTVMSAHRYDGGINTISRTARERKYDAKEKDTTIQPNIGPQIEYSINGPFSKDYTREFEQKHGTIDKGSDVMGGKYNDISVANPEVTGFYIDSDATDKLSSGWPKAYTIRSGEKREGSRWKKMMNLMSQYPDVPVYIREDNQVKEFVIRDGELMPVEIPGKVEKNLPAKTLGEYDLPHVPLDASNQNLKDQMKEHVKENGTYYFSFNALAPIVNELSKPLIIDSSFWKYNGNTGESIAKLLIENPGNEDRVFDAVKQDLESTLQKIKDQRQSFKQRAAEENNHHYFGRGSTYNDITHNQPRFISQGLAGFIGAFEKKGLVSLAEKLKAISLDPK